MLDRTIQPAIKPISKITFPEVEKTTLSNGRPLHLIRDSAQEVVRIDFMFGGGSWHQKKALVAYLCNQMLKEGSANLNSQQIAEKLDFYGSWLQLSASYHNSYLTVYCLSKYVSETLAVVEEMLKRPTFPQAEFEVAVNKRKQSFLLEQQKVQSLASKKFAECIFGENHPYGKTAKAEYFENISTEDLKSFYNEYYSSHKLQIILAGDINQGLISEIENYFGKEHWGAEIAAKKPSFSLNSASEKQQIIPKADAVQSAVRLGRVGIQRNNPDFFGMKVVSTILGGYFGSRLMSNIREEKGYTYGIGCSLSSLKKAGSFAIATECATEYVDPLIAEVYKEMDLLCNELVCAEELEMVKNFMLGDAARLFDGTFSIADACISLLANDLDISFYEKQIQTIRDITAEEIRALAQKYFVKDAFYEIVAGKR